MDRDGDGEAGATARGVSGRDRPGVAFDDGLHDCEPEAGAAVLAGAGLVGALEAFEQVGEVGLGQAGAFISDGDNGGTVVS